VLVRNLCGIVFHGASAVNFGGTINEWFGMCWTLHSIPIAICLDWWELHLACCVLTVWHWGRGHSFIMMGRISTMNLVSHRSRRLCIRNRPGISRASCWEAQWPLCSLHCTQLPLDCEPSLPSRSTFPIQLSTGIHCNPLGEDKALVIDISRAQERSGIRGAPLAVVEEKFNKAIGSQGAD
jgi:hypothetical protein